MLTCLQTIDIGRLTSDPVFLVPGGFIAVTGQGPVDSNESSKTTFEAALSLVHGDPGWRQTSPQFSSYAAELLFNPPNAPAGSRVRADTGFIAAVFAGTDDSSGGMPAEENHLTAWVRIRRHDDPAFEVAVTPGVRLACGGSHAARIEDAKRVWASLRGPKWGPQVYARALYGPGVSCLSYVSTRGGRSEQRTTLLGSDISQLTAEQIAWQLIDLAAMRHLFDNEAAQRVEFFRLSQQLREKEQEVGRAQEAVTAYTRQAEAISRRRQMLDQATVARDRHVARTVLQALDDLAQLHADRERQPPPTPKKRSRPWTRSSERLEALDPAAVARQVARTADELAAARRARQPAAGRADQLRLDIQIVERDLQQATAAAAGWSGRAAAAVEAGCSRAKTAADDARAHAHLASQRRDDAAAHLDAVRHGQAGPAGQRLDQVPISWQLLDDAVEIADHARPLFDPLLVPFSGAICVDPRDHADAVLALAGMPGSMLGLRRRRASRRRDQRTTGSGRPPRMAGGPWQPGRRSSRASRHRDDRWWLRRPGNRPGGAGSGRSRSFDNRHHRSRQSPAAGGRREPGTGDADSGTGRRTGRRTPARPDQTARQPACRSGRGGGRARAAG